MNKAKINHGFRVLMASLAFVLPWSTTHAVTTGFLQPSGTYDYNDPNNWVDGAINGIWDSSLIFTGTPTVTFGSNTVLQTGLSFGYDYPSSPYTLTLRGGSGNRTLTLGGDLIADPVAGKYITVRFGFATSGSFLGVNLGGVNRTVTVKTSKSSFTFYNALTNGSFTAIGGGAVILKGSGDTNADVRVEPSTTLTFDSSASGATGTIRAKNLLLRSGILIVTGNAGAASCDALAKTIRVDASAPGGDASVTITPNAAQNTQLAAESLIRTNNAVLLIRGTTLGNAPGGNVANLFLSAPPTSELVGGGGSSGQRNISILPWVIGSTNAADTGSGFVTYDAVGGIRPLNPATECDNTITDGSVSDHNVYLAPGTSISLNSPCTVNSLFLYATSSSANATISGSGALTLSSGSVYARQSGNSQPAISKPLDFGTREGIIGVGGSPLKVGGISGTGGLTVHSANTPVETSPNAGVRFYTGTSTYTGTTRILGAATLQWNNVLPSGSRTGDVYLHGMLWCNYASMKLVLNGLWGSGTLINGDTVDHPVSLGDNNTTSIFDGVIKESSTGLFSLNKIGNGTLTLNGANLFRGPTAVSNGTLVVNGSLTSPVTVCTNAILGGSGSIAASGTAITVNNGGRVSPGSPSGGIGTFTVTGNAHFAVGSLLQLEANGTQADVLTVSGTVSDGGSPVLVHITASGKGPWKVMTAGSITADFMCNHAGMSLAKTAGDTELWLSLVPSGSVVVVR